MITKAALLLFREELGVKQLLFVRQHDKPFYVFPGGKQDPGETIDQALRREISEELGVQVANVKKLGTVAGQTPDDRDIEMHLYTGALQGRPHPQAEIGEMIWLSQSDIMAKQNVMTPMTCERVLPFLAAKRMW